MAGYTYWDSRASAEDMEDMWNLPEVAKEWNKSGEKRGKVRFPHDDEKRPYLSPAELRVTKLRDIFYEYICNYLTMDFIYLCQAVAEIILFKHFASKRVKSVSSKIYSFIWLNWAAWYCLGFSSFCLYSS